MVIPKNSAKMRLKEKKILSRNRELLKPYTPFLQIDIPGVFLYLTVFSLAKKELPEDNHENNL